jgi:hypothetical protein
MQLDLFAANPTKTKPKEEARKIIDARKPCSYELCTEQQLYRPQPAKITKQGLYITYIINEN